VLVLVISGAFVRATGASWACAGFPTCNGQALPFGTNPLVDIHLTHRLLAYGVAALIGWTLFQAWRTQSHVPAVMAAASALGIAIVAQIAIGASAVSNSLPMYLRGLHVAGAAAVWVSAVALASLSQYSLRSRPSAPAPGDEAAVRKAEPRTLSQKAGAYLSLTKPRIVALLLVTTFAAMVLAAGGLPSLWVVGFTLLGGALSAGAANAINCFIDRDIDRLMVRTMARPLPLGVLSPAEALRFALLLAVVSFAILAVFVNLLAATLSLVGLLFYVFVYTGWLKRSSPSNIVIGGAAGAIPPMVGWAAVTGEVSLLAFFLFAIIFWWTPPHFWALALLIKGEYERAGVPMLPVVKGEAETRRQILLYTLQLVAVTLVMVPLQMVGLFYMAVAALLGGLFVYYTVRLLLDASNAAARRVFRYSLAYLPLLFLAIIVDHQL
jgi:protoheme IX farnesyltransferase